MADGLNGKMMSLARMDSTMSAKWTTHRPVAGGRGFDANLGLMNRCERAFRSDDNLHEIELFVANELVKVIAADAPHDLREPTVDLVPVRANDVGNAALEAATHGRLFEFHFLQSAALARSENDVHLENVIDRLAVDNGVRTRGIVAHHAADRRAIGGRRVRAKQKSHGFQVKVQLLLNHAGLDDSPLLFSIHLENAIQVFRHVDDDGFADRLPRQTRPATARKNGDFKIARDLHRGENILVSSRNHDADRLDFINAGVCAVHQAGSAVEANFTLDAGFQGLVKVVIHNDVVAAGLESLARLDFSFVS